MNTLLVTGTIKPLVKINYCNPEVRCAEYMRNLERYIRDTMFDKIIFAENSGYPVDVSMLYKIAAAGGKEFIMLDVSQNPDCNTMSTGEARIIQQTLAACPFLHDDDYVWKVSGRIYIRNANKILSKTRPNSPNIFLYAPKFDSLQTWFCRVKVGDLKQRLLTDEAINKMRESCIEYAWMDIWKNHKKEMPVMRFPIYPDAEGINSSGQPYTLSKHKFLVKNFLLKLGYFTPKDNRNFDRSGL